MKKENSCGPIFFFIQRTNNNDRIVRSAFKCETGSNSEMVIYYKLTDIPHKGLSAFNQWEKNHFSMPTINESITYFHFH